MAVNTKKEKLDISVDKIMSHKELAEEDKEPSEGNENCETVTPNNKHVNSEIPVSDHDNRHSENGSSVSEGMTDDHSTAAEEKTNHENSETLLNIKNSKAIKTSDNINDNDKTVKEEKKIENNKASEDIEEESEDEGIDDVITDDLDHTARDALYERGLQYESTKKKLALRCFLQCLKGLNDVANFSFLPQCLRKVADIYFANGELEKAIQFIQAEKMYYESALIDTSELQKKLEVRKQIEKSSEEDPAKTTDPKAATPEIVRADEYENLARMCLEQKQPQLALEYQGKATKIRQHIYGDSHPITIQSLDFFTVVYGEVGKQQYSESIEKMQKTMEGEDDTPSQNNKSSNDEVNNSETSPTSILRRRKKPTESTAEKEEKKVRFIESESRREQEEWISHSLLCVLFVMCFLVLAGVSFHLYCKIDTSSGTCASWKTETYYYYMRIKYMYHYYLASKQDEVIG